MDGTCLAAGTVAGEGSFPSGEGTSVEAGVSEDLVEFGWSAEVDSRGCFKKNCEWWGLRRGCGNLHGGYV